MQDVGKRGACVHHQGIVVLDQVSGNTGNAFFVACIGHIALAQIHICVHFSGPHSTAVYAVELSLRFQILQIASDGHLGDAVMLAQFRNAYAALGVDALHDLGSSLFNVDIHRYYLITDFLVFAYCYSNIIISKNQENIKKYKKMWKYRYFIERNIDICSKM